MTNETGNVEENQLPTSQSHDISSSSPGINEKKDNVHLDSSKASPLITKDGDIEYPEGGLRAWLVVFGSWCGLIPSLGIANTLGTFQAYISRNQLNDYSEGTIGWIFSLYAFLVFFCGIYSGPLFDKYGPSWLLLTGSVLIIASMMLVGVCTAYWHFIIVFSILGGVGSALLFTPCISAVGHYFNKKRGNATGLAASGGAVGGIIFPLLLQKLIPEIGFAWSTRIMGFIFIFLCTIANLLVRSRLQPAEDAKANPDFRIFKDPAFALTVAGIYLLEWALFIPLTYISSYALQKGFSEDFAYQILPILNVGSVFGRWLPGYFADKLGRFNVLIITIILTVISVFAIWLPAGGSTVGIVFFVLLFGFSSGGNISLTPVCIGQLCKTENYGRYYATCYTVASIACLTGVPIAGEIITSNGGSYQGLIIFVGMVYFGGFVTLVWARVLGTGWRLKVKY